MKIKALYSSLHSFAAIKEDNSVEAWHHNTDAGCEDPEVKSNAVCKPTNVKNVKTIFTNNKNMAALTYDGQVYTWGYTSSTDIRTLDFVLTDVEHVFTTKQAMIALFKNKT